MDDIIKALTKPEKLYSYSQINDIPKTSGIYAWYFKELPPHVPNDTKYQIKKDEMIFHLLYVGEASNLHRRIRGHYKYQSDSSTLRRSLGVLFHKHNSKCMPPFICKMKPDGTYRYHFPKNGENCLTAWMKKHAFICWAEHKDADEKIRQKIETELMELVLPPLNIKNGTHPFSCKLGKMRCEAELQARKSLIVNR